MNNSSEKWAEICFLLSENINQNIPEKQFENQVVRAIEVLGWREFKHKVKRQPVVQLGREGILRPDLVIYGDDNRALIVVEVKRPLEDITRNHVIGQLRSYMRQMKSDFGFLIGADLRIFYDGPLNPHSDPLLLEKIDFDKNSSSGIDFVKVFNESSLLDGRYNDYLKNKLQKYNRKREIRELTNELVSLETRQKIIGYLRNEFPDIDDETFSEALQRIHIDISREDTQKTSKGSTKKRYSSSKRIIDRQRTQNSEYKLFDNSSISVEIANMYFDSHLGIRLRHIYGVLYFMKQGFDFSLATHQTLKLFSEVQDYQTISDKCARGFAGSVDAFISWFNSGEMLNKLNEKFSLTDHDYKIFKDLLE